MTALLYFLTRKTENEKKGESVCLNKQMKNILLLWVHWFHDWRSNSERNDRLIQCTHFICSSALHIYSTYCFFVPIGERKNNEQRLQWGFFFTKVFASRRPDLTDRDHFTEEKPG